MLETLEIGAAGMRRRVLVERPKDVRPGAPLVLLFHGAYQTPEIIRRRSGLGAALMQSHGAVIAFPAGTGRLWRADWQQGFDHGGDLAFFDGIVREARERWAIDPALVVAAGFSNGGMFAQRLACERSEQVAGIVTSCSSMRMSLVQSKPERVVPVRMRHGRFDPVVHYARPHRSPIGLILGGAYMTEVLPADQALEFWRRHHGSRADVRLVIETGAHRWTDGSTEDVMEILDHAGAPRRPELVSGDVVDA